MILSMMTHFRPDDTGLLPPQRFDFTIRSLFSSAMPLSFLPLYNYVDSTDCHWLGEWEKDHRIQSEPVDERWKFWQQVKEGPNGRKVYQLARCLSTVAYIESKSHKAGTFEKVTDGYGSTEGLVILHDDLELRADWCIWLVRMIGEAQRALQDDKFILDLFSPLSMQGLNLNERHVSGPLIVDGAAIEQHYTQAVYVSPAALNPHRLRFMGMAQEGGIGAYSADGLFYQAAVEAMVPVVTARYSLVQHAGPSVRSPTYGQMPNYPGPAAFLDLEQAITRAGPPPDRAPRKQAIGPNFIDEEPYSNRTNMGQREIQ